MSTDHIYEDDRIIPFLDLEQLKNEEKKPYRIQKKIYKMILSKCHDKIRKLNRTTEYRECKYEIPWFIYGYPGYDLEHVNRYLIHQLSLNGMYAERINPGMIYISWKQEDIDKRQFRIQSQKMTNKPNLYKVGISPLADDPSFPATHPGSKKPRIIKSSPEDADNPVTMLKYDDRFDDLVPVNTKKVSHILPMPTAKAPNHHQQNPHQQNPHQQQHQQNHHQHNPYQHQQNPYQHQQHQQNQYQHQHQQNQHQLGSDGFQHPRPFIPPGNQSIHQSNYAQQHAQPSHIEQYYMPPVQSQPKPLAPQDPVNPYHAKARYGQSHRTVVKKNPRVYPDKSRSGRNAETYRYDNPREHTQY